MQLWSAALALDLATRRAQRAGDATVPGADLKTVLSDAHVMHIAGSSSATHTAILGSFVLRVSLCFMYDYVHVISDARVKHTWHMLPAAYVLSPS